jgi:hypothetical protein
MNESNDKLIYTYDNAISPLLCKTIIDMYEKADNKYNGITSLGYNPDFKDTVDFVIPTNNLKWEKIYTFLNKELAKNLKKYFISLKNFDFYNENNEKNLNISYLGNNFLQYDSFMIQKYFQNKGKFKYHHDFQCDYEKSRFRIITFLFYLNDVEEGGETEIWGNIRIKPTAGKLLFFPASWTYPHCGKMPISSDKYIITGWIYVNHNHYVENRINKIIQDKKNNINENNDTNKNG